MSGDPKPIDFRSDASDELGTTLRRAGIPREFTVSKAGPQNHDTVGSVERGVRELKEGLAGGKQVLTWSTVWLAGKPVQGT